MENKDNRNTNNMAPNSVGGLSDIAEKDITDIIKNAVAVVNKLTEEKRSAITYAAFVAGNCAETAKNQEFNRIVGSSFAETGASDAIRDLFEAVRKNQIAVSRNKGDTWIYSTAELGINRIDEVVKYGKKNTDKITYLKRSKENKSAGIFTFEASFEYDRAEFQDMFLKRQLGLKRGQELEDNEDPIKEKEEDAYLTDNVNISGLLITNLNMWFLLKAAEYIKDNKGRLNVSDKDAEELYIYAKRIYDYPATQSKVGMDQKYYDYTNVIDKLPVITKIVPESQVNAETSGDKIKYTFNVTLKLDMLNTSQNSENNPRFYQIDRMKNYDQQDDMTKRRLRNLFVLYKYIDTGEIPSYFNVPRDIADHMRKEADTLLLNSRSIAKTLSKLDRADFEETLLLKQRSVIDWRSKTENDNKRAGEKMAEHFLLAKDGSITREYPAPIKVTFKSETVGTSALPGGEKSLTISHNINGLFPAKKFLLYDKRDGRISYKTPSALHNGNEKEKVCYIPTAMPFGNTKNQIVYDMVYTIMLTISLYLETQNKTGRGRAIVVWESSANAKKATEESAPTLDYASREYAAALRKALKFAGQTLTMRVHEQGIVLGAESSSKDRNCASSLLGEMRYAADGTFVDDIMEKELGYILYITSRKCDQGNGTSSYSNLIASPIMFTGKTILPMAAATDKRETDQVYNLGDYDAHCNFHNLLQKISDAAIKDGKQAIVIIAMDMPFKIETSNKKVEVIGTNKDNIAQMESRYPGISFFPIFMGGYQIRNAGGKDHLVIKDIYKECSPDSTRVPISAYITGSSGFGRDNPYYKSGTMYQTMRNYYTGRSGALIERYLNGIDTDFHEYINGILLAAHLIENEKCPPKEDKSEGKAKVFSKIKEDVQTANVRYFQGGPGSNITTVNYIELVRYVMDIIHGIEASNVQPESDNH